MVVVNVEWMLLIQKHSDSCPWFPLPCPVCHEMIPRMQVAPVYNIYDMICGVFNCLLYSSTSYDVICLMTKFEVSIFTHSKIGKMTQNSQNEWFEEVKGQSW